MKKHLLLTCLSTGVLLLIVLLVIVHFRNRRIEVSAHTLYSPALGQAWDGTRIVHLSDLHADRFGQNNEELIAKIREQKPDIIVMTGDMILGENTKVLFELTRVLSSDYPVYFINGNHEVGYCRKHSSPEAFEAALKDAGAVVLNNERIRLEKDGQYLDIVGLIPPFNTINVHLAFTASDIRQLVGARAEDAFTLLLSHDPLPLPAYDRWGADLVLCGHVHGGIIRLPKLGGLLGPNFTLFPPYDAGLYRRNQTAMIVSRGLGRGRIPIRVMNPRELVVIDLKAGFAPEA